MALLVVRLATRGRDVINTARRPNTARPGAAAALHTLCTAAPPPPRGSSPSHVSRLVLSMRQRDAVFVMDRISNVVMLNVLLQQQQYIRRVVPDMYNATAGVSWCCLKREMNLPCVVKPWDA